jgi:hypothetical protein
MISTNAKRSELLTVCLESEQHPHNEPDYHPHVVVLHLLDPDQQHGLPLSPIGQEQQ